MTDFSLRIKPSILKPALIRRDILVFNETGFAREKYKRKLLICLSSVSLLIAILLGIAITVNVSGEWYFDAEGNLVGSAPIIYENNPEPFTNYAVLHDKQGSEVLEYYFHSGLYSKIEYNTESEDICPITVYTRAAMREAGVLISEITSMLGIAIVAEIMLFAAIYVIKVAKKKN